MRIIHLEPTRPTVCAIVLALGARLIWTVGRQSRTDLILLGGVMTFQNMLIVAAIALSFATDMAAQAVQ